MPASTSTSHRVTLSTSVSHHLLRTLGTLQNDAVVWGLLADARYSLCIAAIWIDFWAAVRGRFHTLCGKHFKPPSLSTLPIRFYPDFIPPEDEVPSFVLRKLFEELHDHIAEARSAFIGKEVEVVSLL
jgi:hypothetical protein